MELSADSRLYNDAVAAYKFADERLEARTRADYTGSLRRFSIFCQQEGFPDPRTCRFVELPSVLAAYVNQLATQNQSQWPAEKLRAALAWHFSKPEMLAGGHPHDKWEVQTTADGKLVAMGNPARSPIISHILTGLSKSKKRSRTPTRASPMSLAKLTTMIDFLDGATDLNKTMRVWMAAVCSLCFYGMCRINEVLLMKKGDIQFGLQRPSTQDGTRLIEYGCFTIKDRKTDHDPHASRTYNLHDLPDDERAANAFRHVARWFDYASISLHHTWQRDEFAFPALTKIPRGAIKKQQQSVYKPRDATFKNVGVRWNSPMADNNFTQVLNVVAASCGIDESILGDRIWYTSHCFRRGGAQYRFMFAPSDTRWSLKQVKWWAGWAPTEQSETVVRYLLDDVLDREESELGDVLAPDSRPDVHAHQGGGSCCPERVRANVSAGVPRPQYGGVGSIELLADLKDSIAATVQDAVRQIHRPSPDEDPPSTTNDEALISELPDAKSWRDYISQYWSSNPACHQYRAGVDFLPAERKLHRSRLSRMRIIAEHVRSNYNDDNVLFETVLSSEIKGELTVNKILAHIRRRSRND